VPVKVTMPMLGLTMSEGVITQWLKRQGEAVRKGDCLFEVETDKSVMEVEAPEDGVLLKVLTGAGITVPVGATVAVIGAEGENVALPPEEQAPPARKTISPRARRLAEEHQVNWQLIEGTGAEGQITEQDVKAFLERRQQPAAADLQPLPRHRRLLAQRLTQSHLERPHIHLTVPIDMSRASQFRKARGVSYNDLLVKALGICLAGFPQLNSSLEGDRVRLHPHIHIGVAVAAGDDTLLVPVIRHVDKLALREIAAASQTLIEKARQRKLTPDEMSGATFTLSNLGMFGVEQFTAIINPPEAGILAVGVIVEEPRVIDGAVVIRPMMRVTLGVDHRLVDGALAARFLERLKALLEDPEHLDAQ